MGEEALFNKKKDALTRLISEVNSLSLGWDDLAVRLSVEVVLSEAKAALASGEEQAIDTVGEKLHAWKQHLEGERARV